MPTEHAVNDAPTHRAGYGRARLWLGISAVGTIVSASALALGFGVAGAMAPRVPDSDLGQILLLALFVLAYVILHLPFDVCGGYLLPRRFGRAHPALARFVGGLARGVVIQSVLLVGIGTLLLTGGRLAGPFGVIATGVAVSILLLGVRAPLARAVSKLGTADATGPRSEVPTFCLASDDEGFTGGITGILRARGILLPARWRDRLGNDGFRIATLRRMLAVQRGGWLRGRLVALAFTWGGIALSAWVVADAHGTARGVIEMSLIFTLWSFLGLLTLPTLSRAGVVEVDQSLRNIEPDGGAIERALRTLDELQDGEHDRPPFIEAIFHPIPSVRTRVDGPRKHDVRGHWDAARSAIFISAAGLGLLGRAVHCNCGRPALWVFLPAD